MNEARRKKIVKVMAVVLVAFGGSLLYFLFFNSGLNIVPDPADQRSVLVVNDSVHAIRDITFVYQIGNEHAGAQTIDILLPHESTSIKLDTHYIENNAYTLEVSAPYHLSRRLIVQAGPNTNAIPAISVTLEIDPVGTQNKPVIVRLTGKSLDVLSHLVNVSLELTDPASGITPPVSEWGLSPDGESSTTLSFTPIVASDNLSFKIRVFTPSNVLVEREYSILVLPDTDVNVMTPPAPDVNAPDTNAVSDVNGVDANGSVS